MIIRIENILKEIFCLKTYVDIFSVEKPVLSGTRCRWVVADVADA